jgi:hypothetical protein
MITTYTSKDGYVFTKSGVLVGIYIKDGTEVLTSNGPYFYDKGLADEAIHTCWPLWMIKISDKLGVSLDTIKASKTRDYYWTWVFTLGDRYEISHTFRMVVDLYSKRDYEAEMLLFPGVVERYYYMGVVQDKIEGSKISLGKAMQLTTGKMYNIYAEKGIQLRDGLFGIQGGVYLGNRYIFGHPSYNDRNYQSQIVVKMFDNMYY